MSYSTPVVALTANATPSAEKMYLSEGFAAYMSKPVDSRKLEKLLLKLLPKEKINRIT
jgi:CheY-like chemotaxis protein